MSPYNYSLIILAQALLKMAYCRSNAFDLIKLFVGNFIQVLL